MSGNVLSIQNGVAIRNGYLPGKLHNWSTHAERQTALPNGNLHPYGWMLPRTGGGMSMRAEGSGSISSNLIPTINGSIDFTGVGDLTADAALIISMLCAMTGSGSLSADISGLLNMSVDLDGNGDLAATISALGNMLVDLEGSGDLNATIAAYGNMSIDIVVTGAGLTVENIASAVWEELMSNHTTPGSTGAALGAAGAAGDPWIANLPGAYAPGSAGAIIGNLLANIPASVWDELMAAHNIDGSMADELRKKLSQSKFLGLK